MKIGLRIDVDTFRGTKLGVPALNRLLMDKGIKASYFFSVGPDNMGRHLWRLLKPAFLLKILRSNAPGLYGWDIIFKGTFWPGPMIGDKLAEIIKASADDGHEIGLHTWDHHGWQAHIDNMSEKDIYKSISKGVEKLTEITGTAPTCSAVPGWKCTDAVLREKAKFAFDYNSDCRGESIFRPEVDSVELEQPQIPVTLPTYDEVIGRDGINNENYNDHMLSLLKPDELNVLTIHAEAEGISCLEMFEEFIDRARAEKAAEFVPLGNFIREGTVFGKGMIVNRDFPGREGWISCEEKISD
jgi:undecaprenyl phosphate-alpha-L-ara4FN deformylase